ncbi:hypothetical protein AHF37_05649 [Paragonimus kellicotti]|nr:hypothetical protein AHF37_05649 [Paragonimus kellicotti]
MLSIFAAFNANLDASLFSFSLDAVVLIQWTIQTDAILTSLLLQIANICHEKKAPQVQTVACSSQRYYYKLRCLILSRNLCESWAKSSSLTHSYCEGFTGWPFRSEALRMAAKLGLTVLQLSRSSQAGQMRWKMVDRVNGRLLTPNTRTVANKESEVNSQHTVYRVRSVSDYHGSDLLFRGPRSGLVLFQKLGLGSLELVPVFEMRGSGTHRFDALFIWYPQISSYQHHHSIPRQQQIHSVLCCVHEGHSTEKEPGKFPSQHQSGRSRKCNLFDQIQQNAIEKAHQLIRQLVGLPVSQTHNRFTTTVSPQWTSKHRPLPGRLTQSLTYASGLNRSPSASVRRSRNTRGHASNTAASSIGNNDDDRSQILLKESKINATYKCKEAGEDETFRCWNAQSCMSTIRPNEVENEVAPSTGNYQVYGPKVSLYLHLVEKRLNVLNRSPLIVIPDSLINFS